ncbi:MAG: transglutaminase-like domain-containing protein [Planctomycetota bacterium]|nr:transglutaminase-like domain-containing protein [Planctomycetota bacterium]
MKRPDIHFRHIVLSVASGYMILASSLGAAGETEDAVALVPPKYRAAVEEQLAAAGDNRAELLAALRKIPANRREAMAFLVANMPTPDLKSLKKDFLLRQVNYAYKARAEVPWGAGLHDELFFNDVLPYASVNERRDDWREDFYDRFIALARKCRSPGEAAVQLNKEVFRQLEVKYHATKRPKPDQSPYESAAAKYASCTGLSILLVDACRAVAVPARLVGTPLWTNHSGNHTWTEIWDGQWRFLGAAESTRLDDGWFSANAAKADAGRPEHRIYATSLRRTGTSFPMIWDLSIGYVPAEDVTAFYTARRKVTFRILKDGNPAPARLTLRLGGRIVVAGAGESPFVFDLAGGQIYEAHLQPADGGKTTIQEVKIAENGETTIELRM